MAISVFDLCRIRIGPSSSHTVGPMRAAGLFLDDLAARGLLDAVSRVQVQMFGSLGATGKGHGTDKAVILGLQGETPEHVDTDAIPAHLETLRQGASPATAGRPGHRLRSGARPEIPPQQDPPLPSQRSAVSRH